MSGESISASCRRSSGSARECVSQLRQIARARRAQRHAREDALDVADPAQERMQRLVRARVEQRLDRLQPQLAFVRWRRGRDSQRRSSRPPIAVAVRSSTPSSVLSARSDRLDFELEVAARRGVDQERVAALLAAQAAQVRQGGLLRVAHVLQQATGGTRRERHRRRARSRRGHARRTARRARATRHRARNATVDVGGSQLRRRCRSRASSSVTSSSAGRRRSSSAASASAPSSSSA